MTMLRPFQAIRPISYRASQVAAVPYDVVSRQEALQMARGNPWSFLHVSRAEIDLSSEVDVYSDQVYSRAYQNFQQLIQNCPLITDTQSGFYIYRLKKETHTQTGVAATFSIDEYDSGTIKKHERTRQDKEDDRTRHLLALRAQTGPVFLAYRGQRKVSEMTSRIVDECTPLFDFIAEDKVRHTIWSISTQHIHPWVEAFSQIPALYIADGHHRAAAASRARTELKMKNVQNKNTENYHFFLGVAFPAEELRILPYFRSIRDLNGYSATEFIQKLETRFKIVQDNEANEANDNASDHANSDADLLRGEFSMYLKGHWYRLRLRSEFFPQSKNPMALLDVSILQSQLLTPFLGIGDPRTDQRIEFIGGSRGTGELEKQVNLNVATVGFSLHPTSMEELMAVSDTGEMMPPKSTWFDPKLCDGLLSHGI